MALSSVAFQDKATFFTILVLKREEEVARHHNFYIHIILVKLILEDGCNNYLYILSYPTKIQVSSDKLNK